MLAATPSPLPDPSTLADLDPAVSVTFLVASVIFALLLYFGGAIRDRITPPKTDTAAVGRGPVGQHALEPAPGAAVDRAEQRTDQFIDTLLRQIAAAEQREIDLEQEVRRLQQEIRRLETMLWRDPR